MYPLLLPQRVTKKVRSIQIFISWEIIFLCSCYDLFIVIGGTLEWIYSHKKKFYTLHTFSFAQLKNHRA